MNLFHSEKRVAAELENEEMDATALQVMGQTGIAGIVADLLLGFLPLLAGSLIALALLQVFQFNDIAMLHVGILAQVGHEEEVAVAVLELHLRSSEIIGVDAEVCREEALDVALTLDETAHGGGVGVGLCHELHHRFPLATCGSGLEGLYETVTFYGVDGAILLEQILIILFAYIIIRYAQLQCGSEALSDGEHTVVVEQRDEVLSLKYLLSGELVNELSIDKAFFRDFMQQAPTAVVELVDLYESLHLLIVRAGTRVDHTAGRFACSDHAV